MAPSTPPPPPDTSNAATSAATATTRPLFQNAPRPPTSHHLYSPPPPRLPQNPNPSYAQLAPRLPLPQDPSQLLLLSRPVALPASRPAQRPLYMMPYLDQAQGNPVFVRPNHLPNVLIGSVTGTAAAGIPVPSPHQPKVLRSCSFVLLFISIGAF